MTDPATPDRPDVTRAARRLATPDAYETAYPGDRNRRVALITKDAVLVARHHLRETLEAAGFVAADDATALLGLTAEDRAAVESDDGIGAELVADMTDLLDAVKTGGLSEVRRRFRVSDGPSEAKPAGAAALTRYREYDRRCEAGESPQTAEACLRPDDLVDLADAYAAEHPEDDAQPVTRDWLAAEGFAPDKLGVMARGPLHIALGDEHGTGRQYACVRTYPLPEFPATRGSVRRLILALEGSA